MEAGVYLHLGQAAQLIAEEELKQDQEPVLIQLLKMEEVIVLGLLLRAKFATLTIVRLMEAGLHSHLGQAVQLNAEEEHKPEQEPVLTQLLNTVEVFAQEIPQKARLATPTIVQLMEAGRHSHLGQAAQLIAEEGHKSEQEPVLTQLLNTVEVFAQEIPQKARLATPTHVLFMEAGLYSHLGQAAHLIAEEEHKPEQEPVLTQLLNTVEVFAQEIPQKARLATPTHVLFMEVGVHSHPGQAAQLIAEEEHKPEQEPVQTQLLNTVEVFAQEIPQKARLATPTHVLFMEVGVHSHPGQAAQLIAEEEHKPEQEPVQTQLLNTVEVFAQEIPQKPRLATPTHVLFMEAGLYSHLGQAAQLIAEEEHKPEQEPVQTQLLNTVEVSAQEIPQKARLATPTHVLFTEAGLYSHPGTIVQLIAVEVHKQDQEPALIHLPNMEGGIVQGILLKVRLATPMIVQVTIPFKSNYSVFIVTVSVIIGATFE